jgi:NADH-quinone oxidoreductase subunit G
VLPVVSDLTVPRGIAWASFNQDGSIVETLIDADARVTDVKIEVM